MGVRIKGVRALLMGGRMALLRTARAMAIWSSPVSAARAMRPSLPHAQRQVTDTTSLCRHALKGRRPSARRARLEQAAADQPRPTRCRGLACPMRCWRPV